MNPRRIMTIGDYRIMLAQKKKKYLRISLNFAGSPLSTKTSDVKCTLWKYVNIPPELLTTTE